MIPSRQEILYRVFGALQLARLDPGGAQYFDESPQAALRSFFAAVLVAPAFLATTMLTRETAPPVDGFVIAIVLLLSYCLLWTAYPLIAYRVCQTIDREQAFFRYLAATNWASVVVYHFQLVVIIFIVGGLVPGFLAPLVQLALFACVLGYSWFICRSCLKVTGLVAAGFVVLEFVVNTVVVLIADSILYPAGP
ncbi:MAG TPA: hypothetical protein VKP12_12800 [Kiloniellaceae bacterium]|nr:hypothetical protein [Kiloniellaceae bacterium]